MVAPFPTLYFLASMLKIVSKNYFFLRVLRYNNGVQIAGLL